MKFMNYCRYVEDLSYVASIRPKHLEYMAQLDAAAKVWAAGPLADGKGALFIYEAPDRDAAEAIVRSDPFFTEGVFASWELQAWTPRTFRGELTSTK